MTKLIILVSVLMIAAASGCDDTPAAPQPDPRPSIPPKLGSTFMYSEFCIDESGREVAGSSRIVTLTVAAAVTTVFGVRA
jgi:hypothetical protein